MLEVQKRVEAYIPNQRMATIAIAFFGSIFLGLMSQISCPLPFTPIPFTMQTMGLFLLSGIVGPRHAARSVLCYLAQGTLGLPVFSMGSVCPLWFLEPKAGFLISFVIAAFVIGKLIEKRAPLHFAYILFSFLVGQITIFAIGMSWLALFVGFQKAFWLGVVPFMYGAALKIVASALILRGIR